MCDCFIMKDEERIAKNCNSIIEANSVLPTASHIIEGLWFVANRL